MILTKFEREFEDSDGGSRIASLAENRSETWPAMTVTKNGNIDFTINWLAPLHSSTVAYSDDLYWIYQVSWGAKDAIPSDKGIYVIQDKTGTPVYVGKASAGLAARFKVRTESLREYRLSTKPSNPVAGYTLFLATVDQSKYVRLAEKWLIRLLWTADELNTPRVMQNIKDTKSKLEVKSGSVLTITNSASPGPVPGFLRQDVYPYTGPKKI